MPIPIRELLMSVPRTGTWIDTIRLASGLTLFTFALLHFLNHALGLWSLEAMTAFQSWRLAVTRSPPGTALLFFAFTVHLWLALWRIARLRSWRVPAGAAWQLGTGVIVTILILPHLFQAGVAPRVAGGVLSYRGELSLLWPTAWLRQTSLLVLVWAHGCVGLHRWLKGEAWWRRNSHALVAIAVLVPAAAIAGFVTAGREIDRLKVTDTFPLPFARESLPVIKAQGVEAQIVAASLIGLALGFALASTALALRRRRLAIAYDPGPKVFSTPGLTILEISRAHRVPHLSVCGGKARCSTCRVRILRGGEQLAEPSEVELKLLRRIGADPDVRLACQIRPTDALTVSRLLNPETAWSTLAGGLEAGGVVRVAAVLFLDIRGFTRLSESKLAFDVVYILNTFFAEMGRAIELSGGVIDKYMGDGLMAVFEHADGLSTATRNALKAIAAFDVALQKVNGRLAGEIDAPLNVAMGLHGGRLVSGRVGYGEAGRTTVIGRVVNIASRLESLAKARDVELVVSQVCAEAVGLEGDVEAAELRGLEATFSVVIVRRVAEITGVDRAGRNPLVS